MLQAILQVLHMAHGIRRPRGDSGDDVPYQPSVRVNFDCAVPHTRDIFAPLLPITRSSVGLHLTSLNFPPGQF